MGRLWVSLCLLAACAPVDHDDHGRAVQAIFDGTADDVHDAVVAYVSDTGNCSAVIIEVNGDRGHALTAAHCANGALGVLRRGRDSGAPESEYPVVETIVHPLAARVSAFDVAVLRFMGADESTPSLALLDPEDDAFTVGSPLELVGYGLTEKGPSRTRRSVTLPIHDLAPTRMLFDQEAGGFCSGDSGGPALTVSGATRVVAVLQSVAPDCRGIGLAGRLSAIHDSFVMPVLAGAEPALPSCGACFEAAAFTGSDCAAAADECAADSACSAFTRCLDGCSFESCRAACRETEPAGALLHAPLERCLCQTCASSCITEGRCAVDAPNGPSEVPDPPTSDQEPPPSSGGCALAPGARPASIWLGIAAALTLRRRRGRLEDA